MVKRKETNLLIILLITIIIILGVSLVVVFTALQKISPHEESTQESEIVTVPLENKETSELPAEEEVSEVVVPEETEEEGSLEDTQETSCDEAWVCTDWQPGTCPSSGSQTRDCTCACPEDRDCTGNADEEQNCEYVPTCLDGIQNQGEGDVDYGGPCPEVGNIAAAINLDQQGVYNIQITVTDTDGEAMANEWAHFTSSLGNIQEPDKKTSKQGRTETQLYVEEGGSTEICIEVRDYTECLNAQVTG